MPIPRALALALLSSAAVGAAGAGAALGARTRGLPSHVLGWASASAAGLMLGVGHALVVSSVSRAPAATAIGALAAIALLHAVRGAGHDDGVRDAHPSALVRASAVHSAAEGVAIGAAMALRPAFGVALALTLVLHNASEGAVLGAALRDGGTGARGVGPAARAATLARAAQVALALATYGAIAALPAALPWALGAGFGALLYLLFAELLPQSYHAVGRTGIAVVVSVAAGLVALLGADARGALP